MNKVSEIERAANIQRGIVPLSRAMMIYSVMGFENDKPIFKSYGHAIAYDPADHSFASVGMSLEKFRETDNIVLKYSSEYYPKWDSYRQCTKMEIADKFVDYLRQLGTELQEEDQSD